MIVPGNLRHMSSPSVIQRRWTCTLLNSSGSVDHPFDRALRSVFTLYGLWPILFDCIDHSFRLAFLAKFKFFTLYSFPPYLIYNLLHKQQQLLEQVEADVLSSASEMTDCASSSSHRSRAAKRSFDPSVLVLLLSLVSMFHS